MNALEILVGLFINKVEIIQDYFQIIFQDGTILNIYNKYKYEGGSVVSLEGKKLLYVSESNNKILLDFGDNGILSIGLLEEDYNGPEAIGLIRKGEPLVVWQ